MLNRRCLLSGIAALSLGGPPAWATEDASETKAEASPLAPTVVPIQDGIPAGQIHVDPNRFALYWTLPDGQAIRYAVGVGRPGLYEAGAFTVGSKRKWPSWTPTPAMIRRNPKAYARHAGGMPGGPDNPLGARALYLFTAEGHDSHLRIHGTNAPETIGSAVSNGCARLVNDHVIDLYERVPVGTQVFLYPTSWTGV